MKYLGWMFLLSVSFNAFSQTVIEPAPLSIEDDGARKIVVKDNVEANPEDGKLVLGNKKTNEEKKEEVQLESKIEEKKTEEKSLEVTLIPTTTYQAFFTPERYLQFSFGYLASDYEKVHPSLDNGSTLTTFRFVSDMNNRFQMGFGIEIMSDTSSQTVPDNIRALSYRLFADYHLPVFENKFDWLFGLAFSAGDFSIRRLSLNNQGQEVNTKIKSGTLIGLIPSTGLRFYLVGKNSIDLVVEYHQYFSKPQSYMGGFAFVPRFSFVF